MDGLLQPILVLPVYQGGAKFTRALSSLQSVEGHFPRILISLNGAQGSPDEAAVEDYRSAAPTKVEVIQTGKTLPWMEHQYFWLAHLEATGAKSNDWITWFAHDDQLRPRGIAAMVDEQGNWPLTEHTTYLGPWGMRYDPLGSIYDGPPDAPVESWTSFPTSGPLRLPVSEWIAQQLEQPTYINMSGCVTQLESFQQMRDFPIAKPGGMRIEMATAAAPHNRFVQEFPEPIVITYTSKGSDRTTYAKVARKDDAHMAVWWANYLLRHPSGIPAGARCTSRITANALARVVGRGRPVEEDWRYRETVEA